jgi:signal transduction histidine kinase
LQPDARDATKLNVIAGEDEVGDLVKAFDEMLRRVHDTNVRLLESNEALRVQQVEREVLLRREREASRLKDEFLAAVSHELRTPLTSIIGYLELLGTSPGQVSAEAAGHIEVVSRNATRLQRMADDLGDADLVKLAGEAIEAARPAAEAKKLILTLEHDQRAVVRADANRIGQALDNLISNAIKFTPEGGKVNVLIENRDTGYRLHVTDTGFGIPASEQQRLFERFFRSTTASANNVAGTGLGLTIAKTIIDRHGGSIGFDSTEGEGTTFTISLPKRVEQYEAQPKRHEPLVA